jgi:hypothetical protein
MFALFCLTMLAPSVAAAVDCQANWRHSRDEAAAKGRTSRVTMLDMMSPIAVLDRSGKPLCSARVLDDARDGDVGFIFVAQDLVIPREDAQYIQGDKIHMPFMAGWKTIGLIVNDYNQSGQNPESIMKARQTDIDNEEADLEYYLRLSLNDQSLMYRYGESRDIDMKTLRPLQVAYYRAHGIDVPLSAEELAAKKARDARAKAAAMPAFAGLGIPQQYKSMIFDSLYDEAGLGTNCNPDRGSLCRRVDILCLKHFTIQETDALNGITEKTRIGTKILLKDSSGEWVNGFSSFYIEKKKGHWSVIPNWHLFGSTACDG